MSIVLIGMMGCGKSAIGRALEEETSYSVIDADSIIERNEGMTIKSMFDQYGENHFRDLETQFLKDHKTCSNIILSTGGGMVVREINRPLIKNIGTVIYLQAKKETLIHRLINEQSGRPMLKENLEKSVADLLSKRQSIYQSCADYIIDVDDKTIDAIISEIMSLVPIQRT